MAKIKHPRADMSYGFTKMEIELVENGYIISAVDSSNYTRVFVVDTFENLLESINEMSCPEENLEEY